MAVSKRLRFEVLSRDGEACCKCGRRPPEVELQVDHVIPVTLGGSDEPSNLQTLCKECNSGKSSVPPGAPLVEQVSAQAVAMAEALQIVAKERAANRKRASKIHTAFYEEWHAWTNRYGDHEHLPGNWKSNVDQLLNEGLALEDLIELVEVAMNAKAKDTWKYFCGCCWRRLKQDIEKAAKMLSPPAAAQPSLLTTVWEQEDIDQFAEDAAKTARRWLDPNAIASAHCCHLEEGPGDCGDPVCRVQIAEALSFMADRALVKHLRTERARANAEQLEGVANG